jgi:hypothetical protein
LALPGLCLLLIGGTLPQLVLLLQLRDFSIKFCNLFRRES